jgi:L,D-transpeptidase catalytic domain
MRKFIVSPLALASVSIAFLSSACGIANGPSAIRKPERVLYHWQDDGGSGKVSIRISLQDQIAEFKRADRDIGWCYVATGKEGHDTRPGSYSIMEKIEDKHSNRYGWIEDGAGNVVDGDAKPGDRVGAGLTYVAAPMPYWMRLTSYGVGMHGGLIPEPGKPASHGCIRLPKRFVPMLFDAVVVGTPVVITQAPSKHGPEGASPVAMAKTQAEPLAKISKPTTPKRIPDANLAKLKGPNARTPFTDAFNRY